MKWIIAIFAAIIAIVAITGYTGGAKNAAQNYVNVRTGGR